MPAKPTDQRSILLAGQPVAYQLKRSARRTIGLQIDQRGLRVGAPSQARISEIEALLQQHSAWVLDKLAAWRERPAPPTFEVKDGSVIFAFGEPLTVAVSALGRSAWQFGPHTLYLQPGPDGDATPALVAALRSRARQVFAERLAYYAPRLGVALPPLRLSSARTRWGSCSSRGSIALNWRLVFMPLAVVDYVVCHELAHLKEMNHSARFWSVVEQLCPDWQQRRRELRQLARQIPPL